MGRPGFARRVRRLGGNLIRLTPWTRRLVFASTDYKVLTSADAQSGAEPGGWMRGFTARRQQRAYARLLADLRGGHPRIDFTVAAEAVRKTGLTSPSLLEVGCGGGYYSEVFKTLAPPLSYTGIDYSDAMIEQARDSFPDERFETADACALPFPDVAFDIVFNGVSLMHIPDPWRAIQESRRVARRFCIYHSVPVFSSRATTWFQKYAYGAPVIEAVFNRDELIARFREAGLGVVQTWQSIDYDVHPAVPEHSTGETFLLEVVAPSPFETRTP